jgi:hypothetical protein
VSFRYRALVEDRAHEALVRGLLDIRNETHTLRVEPYAPGSGSAEQHVRKQFPFFVADLRAKQHQRNLWGIVIVDGDLVGFQRRRESLLDRLKELSFPPLGSAERIVLLIPTRNVETWAWCLLGNAVNEVDDFKPKLKGEELRRLFAERWRPPQSDEPLSLSTGRKEWSRVED